MKKRERHRNMNPEKRNTYVHTANSFKEAREWEIEHEISLTPERRLETQQWLRRHYCIVNGIEFPEHIAKVIRVYKNGYQDRGVGYGKR